MSWWRDEALPPEGLVGTFASLGGVVVMGEGKAVLCKRRLALLIIPLLLALAFYVADLVTVQTLLVFVGVRLGVSLVLATLGLRFPLAVLVLTVVALAVLALSTLALERGDVHWDDAVLIAGLDIGRHLSGHLVERVESTRMESQMVPDRRVLVAGLEHSLPHVVSHGLAALFLVVPDQVAELFDPIDVLSELPEVIQENLPELVVVFGSQCSENALHTSAPSTFGTFCNLLCASPLLPKHVVQQLSAPHLLGRSEVHVLHVISSSSRSGVFHQSTHFGRVHRPHRTRAHARCSRAYIITFHLRTPHGQVSQVMKRSVSLVHLPPQGRFPSTLPSPAAPTSPPSASSTSEARCWRNSTSAPARWRGSGRHAESAPHTARDCR